MRALTASLLGLFGACGRIGFGDVGEDRSARLVSIEIWASPSTKLETPWSPTFDPAVASYSVGVGLYPQQIRISAVPFDPRTTITIEGAPAAPGELSAPIPLRLGSNPLTVVGTSASTYETYTVDIARAAPLAQEAYLKASNTETTDMFGAAIALSGDTLAVGAPQDDSNAVGVDGDQSDNTATDSGAVFVFTRTGTRWTQQAYLKSSNSEAGDSFGLALGLSGDTLVVGAWGEDSNAAGVDGNQADNSRSNSGAAYVFTRNGTTWSQQAYLKASNPDVNDIFGNRIAISGDTIAVTSWQEDSNATGVNGNQADNTASNSGAVYVFARSGNVWSQQAYLKASNTDAGDNFGGALAVSGDTIVVGANHESSSATGIDGNDLDNTAPSSGAAYVFARVGTTWSQQAYVKASNTELADEFGRSVAVSGDTVVVGALLEDSRATGIDGDQTDNTAPDSGAAYVFARIGSTWSQQGFLKASNSEAGDHFGLPVAISANVVAVGATLESSSAVGLGGDETDNSASHSGAVYIFVHAANAWAQTACVKASNTGADDKFGISVDLSADSVAVSATGEDSSAVGVDGNQGDNSALDSGASYVFRTR